MKTIKMTEEEHLKEWLKEELEIAEYESKLPIEVLFQNDDDDDFIFDQKKCDDDFLRLMNDFEIAIKQDERKEKIEKIEKLNNI